MNTNSSIPAILVAALLLAAPPSDAATPVALGAAGDYAILARSTIANTGTTSVTGNVGISPALAASITGFGLVLPTGGSFSTSPLVTGKVFASDYAAPTPANLAAAVLDMQAAYTNAAARTPDVTGLGSGTLTGLTLAPGVYRWTTGVSITSSLTLQGGPSDVWIFQVAQTLTTAADVRIILKGGAQARHVIWQVAGVTTLGARTQFKGVILDLQAITMSTGAAMEGRLLAQTGVSLNASIVDSGSVAETTSNLLDGSFFIQSSSDPADVTCGIGVEGALFTVYGDARGLGTGNQLVKISYNAPEPTTTDRTRGTVSVKQSQYSTLDITIDGVSAGVGPMAIQRCAVGGSANSETLRGAVSAKCRADDPLGGLSPAELLSIQTAFANSQSVKIRVNTDPPNVAITIKCKGDATPE